MRPAPLPRSALRPGPVAGVLGLLAAGAALLTATPLGDSLNARSPFLPPGTRTADAAPPAEETAPQLEGYEFRGFFAIGDDIRVLLKGPNEPSGRWMRLNEERDALRITGFDRERKRITLRAGGETRQLDLVKLAANSTPIPVEGLAAPTGPATVSAPGATPTRPVRRTVRPPRPPEWIQERMRQQGIDPAASFGNAPQPGAEPAPPEGGFPAVPDLPPEVLAQIQAGNNTGGGTGDPTGGTGDTGGAYAPPGVPNFIPEPPPLPPSGMPLPVNP